jgi:hypothetical protein
MRCFENKVVFSVFRRRSRQTACSTGREVSLVTYRIAAAQAPYAPVPIRVPLSYAFVSASERRTADHLHPIV